MKEQIVNELRELMQGSDPMQDLTDIKCKVEQEGMTMEAKGMIFDLKMRLDELSYNLLHILSEATHAA